VTAARAVAEQVFRQLHDECGTVEMARLVAVPGNESARWLLPAGTWKIGEVLRSWAPHRVWSRVAWGAIRAANQIGRVAQFPGASVLEIEGAPTTDWASMGWRWGGPPIPVIYLGTPGPRRKAVVHLVERSSGRCKAIVKVPLTEQARAAILHEAEVLETLESERYERAPRLLHVDLARGIATQTFVQGRPAGKRPTNEFWWLLESLLLPGEYTAPAAHAAKWALDTDFKAEKAAERKLVAEALDELQDDSPLPACWEHGDFAPWNIKRLPEGGCALLDWEAAQRRGLPLQDAFHFFHMQDFLFERRPKLYAVEVCGDAVRMGIPPRQCRKLEMAYLVGAYVKCKKQGNHERARFVHSTLALLRRKAA
jgi:hypothetical protein